MREQKFLFTHYLRSSVGLYAAIPEDNYVVAMLRHCSKKTKSEIFFTHSVSIDH